MVNPVLGRVRGALVLVTSLALVLLLGGLAAVGPLTTATQVDTSRRQSRLRFEQSLSGLVDQYLQFAFLDAQRAAGSTDWRLRPGDAADTAALRDVVQESPLSSYGAALAGLDGRPLNEFSAHGLPSPTDPGYAPLRRDLLAGRPGLSDVMRGGGHDVVAFAVPVRRAGAPVALLLVFADVRTWPLEGYNTTIELGPKSVPYVVDGQGRVAASGSTALLGQRLPWLPRGATSGGKGVVDVKVHGHRLVVSYAPTGGGWTTVTTQDGSAFDAGLRSRSRREVLAVVVLLTAMALLLGAVNAARLRALRRLADERLLDPLTGLAQRRMFEVRLGAAVARMRRTGQPLSLLYCDLDGFKAINDTYGHNAGDQLLVAVAARLREATRDEDVVVRLGGDEFAVVVEGTDVSQADALAGRLRAAVAKELVLGGTVVQPRLSVGVAVLCEPSRAEDLVTEADLAMYRAKHQGDTTPVVLDALPVEAAEGTPARVEGTCGAR